VLLSRLYRHLFHDLIVSLRQVPRMLDFNSLRWHLRHDNPENVAGLLSALSLRISDFDNSESVLVR